MTSLWHLALKNNIRFLMKIVKSDFTAEVVASIPTKSQLFQKVTVAAANQSGIRHGVVRRAERAAREHRNVAPQ